MSSLRSLASAHKLDDDPPLPDAALDTLTRALESEDYATLKEFYNGATTPTPEFRWSPGSEDLTPPELKFLLSYWDSLRNGRRVPRHTQVDAVDMWAALGFIMLLEVVDGGRDYRYRLYGSKIADRSKIDMTGKRLSEFAIHPLTRAFFISGYRAVTSRREPLATTHVHAPGISIASTTRLILPLADDSDVVTRFLVGNIPGAWRSPD